MVRRAKLEKTKRELRKSSGTPEEFEAAVNKAADDLFCTTEEANVAILRYRREYEAAPD